MTGVCVRCHRDRHIKARRLCEACFHHVTYLGERDMYPPARLLVKDRPLVCDCATSDPEPVYPWDAWQCRHCYRRCEAPT